MKISHKLCNRMDGTKCLMFSLVSSKFLAMRNIALYSVCTIQKKDIAFPMTDWLV